jgi:hypothetical protein
VPISLAFCFLLSSAPPLLLNLHPPPLAVMASDLPPLRYQSENDLKMLRKAIGWQSLGYNSKMQRKMLSLAHPGDFVYFSSYALLRLVPPLSSFFLMLLEYYGLQLQHLSLHSITLVAIFIHFCEMFVGVRSSMRLFRCFYMLCPVNKHSPHLDGYYFQHQTKGPSKYIAALSPGRWERWREDWVLVQTDVHERLMLTTAALTPPPPCRLGAGPPPGASFLPSAGEDPDPSRGQAHIHDGAE